MKYLHVTQLYLTFKRVIWPNLTQFNHFRIFEVDSTSETGFIQVIFLDILDFTFIFDFYQKPSFRICWTQPLFRDNLLEIFEFFWTSKMAPTDDQIENLWKYCDLEDFQFRYSENSVIEISRYKMTRVWSR